MEDEEWRPIPGFEGYYEVSNLGRVRGVDRLIIDRRNRRIFKGRILTPHVGTNGYSSVTMCKANRAQPQLVHRLVLAAFRGEPAEGLVCCHNNGIRTDNRLENLRWDTRGANELDKLGHGTHYNGCKTHCKRGHPFDEANTRIRPDGSRLCRQCKRLMSNAWYSRNHPRKLG